MILNILEKYYHDLNEKNGKMAANFICPRDHEKLSIVETKKVER